MEYVNKRVESEAPEQVQDGNRRWWTANPMAYDWRNRNPHPSGTVEWYDWVDRAFLESARNYATDERPFDRLIPFDELAGKRVLEIGCGLGLHTELMTRAGANVTAVDLTPTAVEATQRRLELKGLTARVLQRDAEQLEAALGPFDFVWSWGVIHHSAHTGRIVRRVGSLLASEGRFNGMVYHRDGTRFWVALIRDWILSGNLLRHSIDEALWRATDGYTARFYPADLLRDLLLAFFEEAQVSVTGQAGDALLMPGRLRSLVERRIARSWLESQLSRVGTFLLFDAHRPIR